MIETLVALERELWCELPPFGSQASLVLTRSTSNLPMIEIHDGNWLIEFASRTGYAALSPGTGYPKVALAEAVFLLHSLPGKYVPASDIDYALRVLTTRLLYLAIRQRQQGDTKGYFAILPLVCLETRFGLKVNSKEYHGRLRAWVPEAGDQWRCYICDQKEPSKLITFDWKELKESDICLTGIMAMECRQLQKIFEPQSNLSSEGRVLFPDPVYPLLDPGDL